MIELPNAARKVPEPLPRRPLTAAELYTIPAEGTNEFSRLSGAKDFVFVKGPVVSQEGGEPRARISSL